MLSELEISNSELLIIEVSAQANKITLPQNATIIEKGRVVAIQAYSVNEMGKTPNGKTVTNVNAFNSTFLTFRNSDTGHDDYHQVPLKDLLRANNSGIMERIKKLKVDVSQSYIEIGDPTLLVVGEVFVLRVVYEPDSIGCKD